MPRPRNQDLIDEVCKWLDKYPQMPTRTVSRHIHNDSFPFLTESAIRSAVRKVRNESCRDSYDFKDLKKYKRTEEEKKLAISNKLPQSDYEPVEPFHIPIGNNNILFLTDIHLPYHDIQALQVAIDYGKERKVNAVYLNGDTLDMYQASRFVKDRRMRDLHGEFEMCRDFLDYLKQELNCPIYYKIGNHEDRLEIYLRTNAPELAMLPDVRLENLLRFGEKGVQLIESKQIAYAGKLALLHGHEFGHSVFSPVNAARGLYMRAKESSVIGHHHQSSEHSEKSLSGEVVTTWSVGSLCGLQPDYYPFNKWNHGFAHIKFEENGNYRMKNIRIINGEIV